MENRFLQGLSLNNFRGIGEGGVRLTGFQKINFFIGPNNSGKSTVLYFLANYLNPDERIPGRDPWSRAYSSLDVRLGRSSDSIGFAIGVPLSKFHKAVDAAVAHRFSTAIERIGRALAIEGMVWLRPTKDGRGLEFEIADGQEPADWLGHSEWKTLWTALTGVSGGSLRQHWISQTLQRMAQGCSVSHPKVRFIPAIRQISEKGSEFTDYSGQGLIDQLAELQNPPHDEREKKKKFERINAFLQSVTDKPEARIEVPHDRRHLLVDMDGKMLPLSSLGTGIHEVIMLASFCTLVENEIVCVEEPEIHLHPLLQRKLIRYLSDTTSNQYFIATHSASVLDAVQASVFSVQNQDGDTKVSLAVKAGDRFEVCKRLGYRASDLLQANSIIWVEGPSDRIYLKHWINSFASDLVEGLDFSIMFYGGRLLSHLSAGDEEISEFIRLRRLNRNVAILIDSDKATPHAKINATKARVLSELGEEACWITAGREIENYVPTSLIENALENIYPSKFGALADGTRYAHRLNFIGRDRAKTLFTDVDKVKVAQKIVQKPAELTELDLGKRLQALVEMVRESSPGS